MLTIFHFVGTYKESGSGNKKVNWYCLVRLSFALYNSRGKNQNFHTDMYLCSFIFLLDNNFSYFYEKKYLKPVAATNKYFYILLAPLLKKIRLYYVFLEVLKNSVLKEWWAIELKNPNV